MDTDIKDRAVTIMHEFIGEVTAEDMVRILAAFLKRQDAQSKKFEGLVILEEKRSHVYML